MREIVAQIMDWLAAGRQVAVATVVGTGGSTPRPIGARLLVTAEGDFAGSVSGGCVEGAVIQEAEGVLHEGRPRLLHYGISDEMGWEVGLACGGTIDVLVQPADAEIWQALDQRFSAGTPCVLLTRIDETDELGRQAVVTTDAVTPTGTQLPAAVTWARALLAGRSATAHAKVHPLNSGARVLAEPFLPPPQLIIFGGVHVAIPLCKMARLLGYRVVIADPRGRFANPERFPEADQLLAEWPDKALAQLRVDGRTAIVILTHDPKIDEPALLGALETDAFYIGAIGSRKTHQARFERMGRLGVSAEQLQRVHGPVGLDIGGSTPEELALSILSEIMAVQNGRSGGFMRHTPSR